MKKNIEKANKKIKDTNQAGLLIQGILGIFLLAFSVMTIFEKAFLPLTEITVSFMMFVMAYNNHKTFKRKGITYAYLIAGCLMLMLSVVLILK